MRTIKFRRYNPKTGLFEFLELAHHAILTGLAIPSCGSWDELGPWEQFTGLHDKNGKKIYEGDILATENKEGIDPDGGTCDKWERSLLPHQPVKFSPTWLAFDGVGDLHEHSSIYNTRFAEVIGNIHKNPELLK